MAGSSAEMLVDRAACFLEVFRGPDALDEFWDAVVGKVWTRWQEECGVTSGAVGAVDRVWQYSLRIFPVPRYLVRFRTPSKALLTLEGRALQNSVGGPWQVVCSTHLRRLDFLGLPSPPASAAARIAGEFGSWWPGRPIVWEALERWPAPPEAWDMRLAPRGRVGPCFLWDDVCLSALLTAHTGEAGSTLFKAAKQDDAWRSLVDLGGLFQRRLQGVTAPVLARVSDGSLAGI